MTPGRWVSAMASRLPRCERAASRSSGPALVADPTSRSRRGTGTANRRWSLSSSVASRHLAETPWSSRPDPNAPRGLRNGSWCAAGCSSTGDIKGRLGGVLGWVSPERAGGVDPGSWTSDAERVIWSSRVGVGSMLQLGGALSPGSVDARRTLSPRARATRPVRTVRPPRQPIRWSSCGRRAVA